MSVINSDSVRAGASGSEDAYIIENSIRLNSGDSAYMYRAWSASPTDQNDWTFSTWLKRARLDTSGTHGAIMGCSTISSKQGWLYFSSTDVIQLYADGGYTSGTYDLTTTQKFRDTSGWMHIMIAVSQDHSTATERARMYINGAEVTAFGVDTNTAGATGVICLNRASTTHNFGRRVQSGYSDLYMAETIWIDGQQLTPSSFGEFNSNGIWVPIDPSDQNFTFGDDGCWLDYAVAPGTGNGAGTDVSGKANHFTDSGLVAADQMTDSPTDDADNDIGNYCTMSVLDKDPALVVSDGQLTVLGSGYENGRGTQNCFDKCYFEAKMVTTSYAGTGGGARNQSGVGTAQWYLIGGHLESSTYGWATDQNLSPFVAGVNGSAPGGSWDAGETICWALETNGDDVDIWYRVNDGSWLINGGDPAASSSPSMVAADTAIEDLFPGVTVYSSTDKQTWNFGANGFDYTPPSGFKAMHTGNHPAPAIKDGSAYFQPTLYAGNGTAIGSGGKVVNQSGNSTFQPDLVWIKNRDAADQHILTDAARGVTKYLSPDVTEVEATDTETLSTFDSDGFTVGNDVQVNTNTEDYVAWQWNTQGGAGSSNTAGTINTTTTSVGTTQGMSISTYTGTGSAATIGHGLGVAPEFIMVKERTNDVGSWYVYHHKNTAAPATDYLVLEATTVTADDATVWNDTAPTSTVFSIGTHDDINESSGTYVAYCWAGIEGYSKFGSYFGNGQAIGAFAWCGFRPAWVMIKNPAGGENWYIMDSTRNPYDAGSGKILISDAADTEIAASARYEDFLATGFKLRSADGSVNTAGTEYIFVAFAEFPFGGSGVAQSRAGP